ncbi:mannonate dehydratase [Alkalihalobacillus sp. LMS39]|uniref:mannonate dehydratase n=1 Tax=Alkalihalobacillus sp. LMS39 TaxID=2924032 RepID=UPI001FB532FA|nr:mannonate dehydratase [Alkalihalobacillus sp. LMS39]UOE93571.1 mannonate dehydratase [Alkalihalobacillus sp. LMS39]
MRMVFRWFGEGNDSIPLEYVKQIPGVEGVVWALHDIPAGEEWPLERIVQVKQQADVHGFHIDVVESVNVHEDIKLGLPTREYYIENYKNTIQSLATVGVKVICYNFMPVFDWTRTDLYKELEDGSTALFFENEKIKQIDPLVLVNTIANNSSLTMPGWEPRRLQSITRLFEQYKYVSEEELWANLEYFLKCIIPVAEKNGIKMAIHPDDPPFSVFGLPRIITNKDNIQRLLKLVDHPNNGLTLCSGSLGANPKLDVAELVKEFADRIHFAHIRNVKIFENGDFVETSHRSKDGTVNLIKVMKAYHDIGYKGYARPDHGRHIWGESCRPGYGLYDRGLGIMYLWGIWDLLERQKEEEIPC